MQYEYLEYLTHDEEQVHVTYARVLGAYRADTGADDYPNDAVKKRMLVYCALDVAENARAITEEEAADLFGEEGTPEMDTAIQDWSGVSVALDNIF